MQKRDALPAEVDLRENSYMPPVWDQGQLGSCVPHGVTGAIVYSALQQGETVNGLSNDNAGYSRLFVYYNGRKMEGTVRSDSGMQVRDGIKTYAQTGSPPETDWPYDIAKFEDKPSDSSYNDATAHEALSYKRIIPDSMGSPIHTALANGNPVVFGFSVPDYFEGGGWNPAAGVPLRLPDSNTQWVGGHCVLAVGYSHSKNDAILCRNSWSTNWGMDGYFWMDHGWFDPWRNLSSDFWVVYRVK